MIVCKSQKLYFRTSLGLFPISSIDYTSKTLTVFHGSCSSSEQFVSPTLLSAGFPSPPNPNSLLLFNCSHKRHPAAAFIRNCSRLHMCRPSSEDPRYCLVVNDIERLDPDFHPKDLGCSSYKRVYRRSLSEEEYGGVDLGTRISFDIPDHVPDICNECRKPNGSCGVGLKCICHAKECKDKVLSATGSLNTGNQRSNTTTIHYVFRCTKFRSDRVNLGRQSTCNSDYTYQGEFISKGHMYAFSILIGFLMVQRRRA